MTSTLQQAPFAVQTTPGLSSHHLIDYAHHLGIHVHWDATTGHHAAYSQTHGAILIDPTLTEAETRSLLAHELAHAHHGDKGPQPAHIEARAWRWAARLLLSDGEYAAAERLYSGSVPAMAEALDVTAEIIYGYQDHLERTTP